MGQSKSPYFGAPRPSFGPENAFIYRAACGAPKAFLRNREQPDFTGAYHRMRTCRLSSVRLVSMYDVSPSIALDLGVHYIETA